MWSSSFSAAHTPDGDRLLADVEVEEAGQLGALSASRPAASSNRRIRTIRRCRSIWTSCRQFHPRRPFLDLDVVRRTDAISRSRREPSAASGAAARSTRACPTSIVRSAGSSPARAPCRSGRGSGRACCTAPRPSPSVAQVHHQCCASAVGPVGLDEARRVALPVVCSSGRSAARSVVLAEVQLVVGLERLDAGDQPVIGLGDLDQVRLDRADGRRTGCRACRPRAGSTRGCRRRSVRRGRARRWCRAARPIARRPRPTRGCARCASLGRPHVARVADQDRCRWRSPSASS